MNRINLNVGTTVLPLGLVIFLNPIFLQGAPVHLHPGWRTTLNAPTNLDHCFETLCFVNTIASQGSFFFGFARTSDGLSTLAIAIISLGSNGQTTSMQLVWRANRNNPVHDNSTLTLSSGNLILQDKDSTNIIWSTNIPQNKIVSKLEIRDWSVVVLDSQNRTVWDTFDFPTDTLLPGLVLRRKMSLVADSSPVNASEGSYKMVMESDALVLYTTHLPFWTSQKVANFTTAHLQMKEDGGGTPGIDKFIYFTIMICDDHERCFEAFRAYIGNLAAPEYYFLRLDSDGVLRYKYLDETVQQWKGQLTNDTRACMHPTSCGGGGVCSLTDSAETCTCPGAFRYRNASNERQGCVPAWNSTSCKNTTVDLLEVHGVSYFANQYTNPTLRDGTLVECKKVCLENCTCAAAFFWSDYSVNGSLCFLAFEPLLSMYMVESALSDVGDYVAFVKYVGGGGGGGGSGVSTAWKVGIGVLIGGVVLIFVLVFVFFGVKRGHGEDLDPVVFVPKIFSFKEMESATRRFSKVLGEGGFGTVFEGVLPSGHKVAVKRLKDSRQGEKEFSAEVETLALNHLHLVRLWGFCSEGAHRMLVYECMNNGSLDRWLFKSAFLRWENRHQIAIDTAKGLSYLHHDCRQNIVHLDVKPQNILLDDAFRAKVADFGMSKFFDEKKTEEVVTNMRGTRGYLAPEWLSHAGITVKCDVYSYGMVLLELVSGRKNVDMNASPEEYYFPTWAVQRLREQRWNDVVDARLQELLSSEDWLQVKRVVEIAMWCIQDAPELRPTMAMVVQMLEGAMEVDYPPLQFDFLAMTTMSASTSTAQSEVLSNNSDMMSRRKVVEIGSFCNPDSNSCLSPR